MCSHPTSSATNHSDPTIASNPIKTTHFIDALINNTYRIMCTNGAKVSHLATSAPPVMPRDQHLPSVLTGMSDLMVQSLWTWQTWPPSLNSRVKRHQRPELSRPLPSRFHSHCLRTARLGSKDTPKDSSTEKAWVLHYPSLPHPSPPSDLSC